ncbi:glutamate--tRNA ligase family protein [Reyranella sp.]|uniref:glutamate--tRNA ligase family protein n=1 Tax=Reyranella sp. TaxID=1929291 RepID=UPI00387E7236
MLAISGPRSSNWLCARQRCGTFILRLDDTDVARSRPEFEAAIEPLMEDAAFLAEAAAKLPAEPWDERSGKAGRPASAARAARSSIRYVWRSLARRRDPRWRSCSR